MFNYGEKIDDNLFSLIDKIDKPQILELGVQEGVSTKKFLEICNKNKETYIQLILMIVVRFQVILDGNL